MTDKRLLSLEEACKAKKLDRFAKEHPTTGSKQEFDHLLSRMINRGDIKDRKV